MNPESVGPMLDVDTAAQLLRCAASTVEERARSGDLPGLKFGDGGWVFPTEAFFARLNELAIEQAAQRRKPSPRRSAILHPVPGPKPKRTPPVLPTLKD